MAKGRPRPLARSPDRPFRVISIDRTGCGARKPGSAHGFKDGETVARISIVTPALTGMRNRYGLTGLQADGLPTASAFGGGGVPSWKAACRDSGSAVFVSPSSRAFPSG